MKTVLVVLACLLSSMSAHASDGDLLCSHYLSADERAQRFFGAGTIAAYAALAAKHTDFKNQYFTALKELPSANPAVRPATREERTALTVAWNDHQRFEEALVKATRTDGEEVAEALRRLCAADPDRPLPSVVLRLLEERTEGLL